MEGGVCTPLRGESCGIPVKEASELNSQKSMLYCRPWTALGSSIKGLDDSCLSPSGVPFPIIVAWAIGKLYYDNEK